MFVVFGATGHTGAVVASTLLSRGATVRVVARDPGKVAALAARGAEVVHGDVLDAASVRAALAGATGAYLLVPPDPTSTGFVARGRGIVDTYAAALRAQPVPHVVFLSSFGAQVPAGTGPIVITHHAEQVLGALPATAATFVRAAYFMENLLGFAHPMKHDGVLPVFGGGEGYPFPMVATQDIGEVAAEALLAPPKATSWIELSGPQEYSFDDAAREATAILGRPVKAVAAPLEAMVPTFTGLGFSADVAGLYREMTESIGKGLVTFEGKGQQRRGKVTLEQALRAGLAG